VDEELGVRVSVECFIWLRLADMILAQRKAGTTFVVDDVIADEWKLT
jgi:hypothetical protein